MSHKDEAQGANPLTTRAPTLNPYVSAGGLLLARLAWDIRPESFGSRRRLKALHNSRAGESAVILCNGPSLLDVDFDILGDVFTFGLNKINLLFDKTTFRPNCITAVNQHVIDQNQGFFNETEIPLFLDSRAIRKVRARKNIAYLHETTKPGFARDCSVSIFQGHTVTFVAMQLAFHMGFNRVALVGCDHNFAVSGPANAEVVSGETDESHFDPNYFAGGVPWHLPDLFESEVNYVRAGNHYEAHGRQLINCTTGGKLEVFPRQPLEDFLRRSC